ncbi:hypothetical protein [Tenacibaculum haliotis]|nr:hypothetical protein [Tenacibaculum haliotis]MCT4698493.1 hypothetical protein [Tenacibaculum haliotis]
MKAVNFEVKTIVDGEGNSCYAIEVCDSYRFWINFGSKPTGRDRVGNCG